MPITIYTANVTGVENNCRYPNRVEIIDQESLVKAVSRDYVCAEYKDSYRNVDNFSSSNCCAGDCDNDHSDNPADWVTPEHVAKAFPGVSFWVHYSRHHNKPKKNKSARPRFHVGFRRKRSLILLNSKGLNKWCISVFHFLILKQWIQRISFMALE